MNLHYQIEVSSLILLVASTLLLQAANSFAKQPCSPRTDPIPPVSPNYTTTPIPFEEPEVEFLDLDNKSIVDWDNGFKDCGVPMEGCDKNQSDTMDYFKNPSFCRCDKECIKYGDCCVTVLKEIREIPKEPYWRCVPLPNSKKHAVRMISKCPLSFPNNLNKQLCEQPEDCRRNPLVNAPQQCPLLDVPVLHKQTLDLYRNIFCSRCHSIHNNKLYNIPEQILCSDDRYQHIANWTWENFTRRAIYHPKSLEWVDPKLVPTFSCSRSIKEFHPESIKRLVPHVRFCPASPNESCPLELGEEERLVLHNLCHTYMQVVVIPVGGEKPKFFKNPHCAKCNYPDINMTRTPMCNRMRDRFLSVHDVSSTNKASVELFGFAADGLDDECEEMDEKHTNANFPILITLLSLSVLLLFSFLIVLYLILPKRLYSK
ncbi:hypothetical protein Ocin01_16262 [Orchesella cincta]|uniref:SMB domain-containing protein n=1 Tax=Orchesella cincta TaxID=48709 RepID=A0A1D2MBY3_ORCCI|nr:hypothetical protein Ocin01_16262 [Orchesella cincta]